MLLLELVVIAVGLSMDAFAVAVCTGLGLQKPKLKDYLTVGLYFGIFQALMPLIGYFVGLQFASRIESADHWVAFALLALISGRMIWESRSKEADSCPADISTSPCRMLPLAVATSIDALAVGLTLAFLNMPVAFSVTLIGVTTFIISILGVKAGRLFGGRFKSKAELAGGVILALVGLKILLGHMGVI